MLLRIQCLFMMVYITMYKSFFVNVFTIQPYHDNNNYNNRILEKFNRAIIFDMYICTNRISDVYNLYLFDYDVSDVYKVYR